MNAAEARKITDAANTTVDPMLLASVMETIRRSADRGSSSVNIGLPYLKGRSKSYMRELEKLGYSVRVVSDQRDDDYLEIKW